MKKILNFRPLFYCFIAFLSAILFAQYIFASNYVYVVVICLAIIGLTVLAIIRKKFIAFICILLFFSAGLLAYGLDVNTYDVKPLPEGIIVAQVESINNKETTQYVILKDVFLDGEQIDSNVQVRIYGAPYLSIGDIIEFVGDLDKSGYTNYYGNFRSDYYKNNVRYVENISGSEIEILGNKALLDNTIQNAIQLRLKQTMSDKNASVAFAMLFGDKSEVDNETLNDYRTSGIAHILAVSGLHIGILVGFLYWVLKKCKVKNWISLIIISAVLIFYCYLCGFSTSVVRATIMSICLLSSTLFGKKYDSLNAIGLAGLLLLISRPLYALDVGFQLSFGCVIAIAIFYRPIFNFLRKIKFPKWLAGALSVSISTQILILPILINAFNGVSILSIFLNVLVIPIFSIAYLITFIFTPFLFASDFFGNFIWFANILMDGINICANYISSLWWSVIPNFKFSLLAFATFYTIIFITSRLIFLKPRIKLITCLSIFIISTTTIGILQLV